MSFDLLHGTWIAQTDGLAICGTPTRAGRPCMIPLEPNATACHIHDPERAYALQRPAYRARLLTQGGRM